MKTKEEPNAIKEEIEALKENLAGLTDEELKQVAGGTGDRGEIWFCKYCCTATFQTWIGVGPGRVRAGKAQQPFYRVVRIQG